MKKLNLIGAVVALALPGVVATAHGQIANSAHDWSTESWNVTKDLCGPCHMAHGGDPGNQPIPLWSRGTQFHVGWTVFTSPSVQNSGLTIRQPDGSSKACLSCHDGTLAYNQLKGQQVGPTAYTVAGSYVIGNTFAPFNLGGDHPISFSYVEAYSKVQTNSLQAIGTVLSSSAGTLSVGNNLNGQTVQSAFLKGVGLTDVQCSSCHDVHRQTGDSGFNSNKPINTTGHNPLLVVFNIGSDGYGSGLCRSCHNK